MVTRKNNKTAFAATQTPAGLGIAYSVPRKGVPQAAKLTIKEGRKTISLSGNQVRALTNVIRRAKRLAR